MLSQIKPQAPVIIVNNLSKISSRKISNEIRRAKIVRIKHNTSMAAPHVTAESIANTREESIKIATDTLNRVRASFPPTQATRDAAFDSCEVTSKVSSHANGYIKAKPSLPPPAPAQRNEIYLHQLALVAAGRGDELATCWDGSGTGKMTGREVSHRCHVPGCFQEKHILVEDEPVNKKRNYCIAFMVNGVRYTNCMCNPPCILRLTEIRRED